MEACRLHVGNCWSMYRALQTANSNAFTSVSTSNPVFNDYLVVNPQELYPFKATCKEKKELTKSQGNQEGPMVTRVFFLLPLNFLKDGHDFLLAKGTLETGQETSLVNRTLIQMGHWGHWRGARISQLPRWSFRTASTGGWVWRIKATFQLHLIPTSRALWSAGCVQVDGISLRLHWWYLWTRKLKAMLKVSGCERK